MKFWHDFAINNCRDASMNPAKNKNTLIRLLNPLAKAQSTQRDNITNSAFLCVSVRANKIENKY